MEQELTPHRRILEEHVVPGQRLGRHVSHDVRSWSYRIQRQAAPLRSVWHRRLVPVYDQGDLGSCVAHAGMGVLSTSPFRRHCGSERTIRNVYSQLTAVDDVPGQWPPTDTGSDGLSFAKYAKSRGWCSSYLHAFGIEDFIHGLQRSALMVGTEWPDGNDRPDSTGRVIPTGASRGGHEYEAARYQQRGTVRNDHEDRIWFWNSWGKSWGHRGRMWMTVADFAGLLERQGDATQLVP